MLDTREGPVFAYQKQGPNRPWLDGQADGPNQFCLRKEQRARRGIKGKREGARMTEEMGPRQPAPEGADQKRGRRPPPAGTGIAIGVCLGAGVGLPLQNLALGIAIAVAFAVAFELAFKKQRETEAG